jgi:hypothetical protein
VANTNLGDAKRAKNDEFYTQYHDIGKEMNAYLELNPGVFTNKTILLPCDDPEWSNFTKYFAQNFTKLGLKKLISTSYALDSKPSILNLQASLFEIESPQYDSNKARSKGKIFTLTEDSNGDQKINFEDLEWAYLDGDGDFRSSEITKLRDEADIIITNPPFSLFREFLAWLIESKKLFSIIGSMNAITLKEVFPLIRDSKMWLGNGFTAGNAYFESPVGREYASGVFDEKTGLVKFRNVIWYTNIDHGKRHKPLSLMSTEDNIKFSNHKEIRGNGYRSYENYDAIDVPFTDAIPSDHDGVMGVPISFLEKYSPEQFEILGITQRNDDPYKTKRFTSSEYKNANDLNARAVVMVDGKPKSVYARILIRHKSRNSL